MAKSSLRNDLFYVIIFSSFIPTIFASALLVSSYNEEKRQHNLANQIAEDQTKFSLALYLEKLNDISLRIAHSNELSSFLMAPTLLRSTLSDLLHAKILDSVGTERSIVNLCVLNLSKDIIFTLYESKCKSLDRNVGFTISGDKKSLLVSIPISLDDQYLSGASAIDKGYIYYDISTEWLAAKFPALEEIKQIAMPINIENLQITTKPLLVNTKNLTPYLLVVGLILLLSLIIGLRHASRRLLVPIGKLRQHIGGKIDIVLESHSENELEHLKDTFDAYIKFKAETEHKLMDRSRKEGVYQQAKQVAHDIRSPLSALNVLLSAAQQMPEQHRSLMKSAIKRINDIANDLLARENPDVGPDFENQSAGIENCFLLVEAVVSEKRLQLMPNSKVLIELVADKKFAHAFVKVSHGLFSRIISNLIQNSIEAFSPRNHGNITIKLDLNAGNVLMTLADDGNGIPNYILAQLGHTPISHDKDRIPGSGSGLGVFNAFKWIKSWGGSIHYQSTPESGTLVGICLPQINPPDWFTSTVQVPSNKKIFIVDDDESIHHVWQELFCSVDPDIQFVHFYSAEEFLQSMKTYSQNAFEGLFLIDFEFINEKLSGIDLIKKLPPDTKHILVTSYYNDSRVLNFCKHHPTKLIPKQLAPYIDVLPTARSE